MPPSEMQRLALYETLIDRLGDEAAATLMEHLPPGGWENVTTKDDLRLVKDDVRLVKDELRLVGERLTGKIDGLDTKIESSLTALRGEFGLPMARQTRTMVFTMVGIAITIWLALLLPIGAG